MGAICKFLLKPDVKHIKDQPILQIMHHNSYPIKVKAQMINWLILQNLIHINSKLSNNSTNI